MSGAGVGQLSVGVVFVEAVAAPSCETVTTWPAIVMMPMRLDVEVSAWTWNGTFPLPVPCVAQSDTQDRVVVAVQPQAVLVETATE